MKKTLAIALILTAILSFTGCNKQIFDLDYSFDKAIIKMPDGEAKIVHISKWKDYDGEQLQITGKDGTVYLVSSVNCVLIREK